MLLISGSGGTSGLPVTFDLTLACHSRRYFNHETLGSFACICDRITSLLDSIVTDGGASVESRVSARQHD
jgi:hypothetical protein